MPSSTHDRVHKHAHSSGVQVSTYSHCLQRASLAPNVLQMNFSSFYDSLFFRSKGGGCSCLVSRVHGGSFAAAHQTRAALSTALTAPCNFICGNNF